MTDIAAGKVFKPALKLSLYIIAVSITQIVYNFNGSPSQNFIRDLPIILLFSITFLIFSGYFIVIIVSVFSRFADNYLHRLFFMSLFFLLSFAVFALVMSDGFESSSLYVIPLGLGFIFLIERLFEGLKTEED